MNCKLLIFLSVIHAYAILILYLITLVYMDKFIALYLAPSSVMDAWMKTDPEVMKVEERKMQAAWDVWMEKNKSAIKESAGAGKVKRVTAGGTEDARNDVMMYSMVEAESHEAAAKMFEDHPHLEIPQSSIEIMRCNFMPGMN